MLMLLLQLVLLFAILTQAILHQSFYIFYKIHYFYLMFLKKIATLAKQKRLSIPFDNHVASNPFDLVHRDTWWPFRVPSYNGFGLFLTIVDDCSCFTWVFLRHHKFDALDMVPCFFRMIETEYSKKIKVLSSDNAPELKFVDFFAEMVLFISFHVLKNLNKTQ